jgi:hypothetical protein
MVAGEDHDVSRLLALHGGVEPGVFFDHKAQDGAQFGVVCDRHLMWNPKKIGFVGVERAVRAGGGGGVQPAGERPEAGLAQRLREVVHIEQRAEAARDGEARKAKRVVQHRCSERRGCSSKRRGVQPEPRRPFAASPPWSVLMTR